MTASRYTTAQAAEALGVSVRTFQRAVKRHDIPSDSVTRGRARYKLYTASTVAYLRQQLVVPLDATGDPPHDSQPASHGTDIRTTDGPSRPDSALSIGMAALVAELATLRTERQALTAQLLAERDLRHAAELDAARLRALMTPPPPGPPVRPRRRWWPWSRRR